MDEFEIVEHARQHTAVVRRTVPLQGLSDFFTHALGATIAELMRQGLQPAGPPVARYHRVADGSADVEAGFPVAAPVRAEGDVTPGELPACRAIQTVHAGAYDTLETTYEKLEAAAEELGLHPERGMWESYLAGPGDTADPAGWRTLVTWPVTGPEA